MKMKSDAKLDALAKVPSFRSLDRKELAKVAKIADELHMHAGDQLCVEGEHGEWCFVLVDAEAEVTLAGQPIATLEAGEVCGELALLDGGPRAATVTLTRGGQVLLLPRAAFLDLLEEAPSMMRALLASLGERLRMANAVGAGGVIAGG